MALYDNKSLLDYLTDLAILDKNQLEEVYKSAVNQNLPLGNLLLEKDLISEINLAKAISTLTLIPFVELSEKVIPPDVLQIISEVVAKKNKVISFAKDKDGLHLAMVDPSNKELTDLISKKTGLPLVLHLATNQDITNALALYSTDIAKAFDEIINQTVSQVQGKKAEEVELPIIKIVDTILAYAYKNRASDVHIEPEKEHALIRFRIDSVLHDIVKLPLDVHYQIVTRIKVMANLRTDEHLAPQDGKLQVTSEDEEIDIRVSIVPVVNGEKVVMRILSEYSRRFTLTNLGLSDVCQKQLESSYQKPYGMILSTGPTGCGKTTTLYTILKKLNNRDVNIMTIEDPVEYEIENINQIQVNQKTNLTFATGLRSIVRQDPNIILVGEIRDQETADIAVNSAMTGHLVLSTLHTNDAATTFPRIMEMGIEPFLIASSINIIIGQRLVRTICQKCRTSVEVDIDYINKYFSKEITAKYFGNNQKVILYKGKGCEICHQTGYVGRTGIFEVLSIDSSIREAIVSKQDAGVIKQLAVKNGMLPMMEDGLDKVKQGITTIEEIIRVTNE